MSSTPIHQLNTEAFHLLDELQRAIDPTPECYTDPTRVQPIRLSLSIAAQLIYEASEHHLVWGYHPNPNHFPGPYPGPYPVLYGYWMETPAPAWRVQFKGAAWIAPGSKQVTHPSAVQAVHHREVVDRLSGVFTKGYQVVPSIAIHYDETHLIWHDLIVPWPYPPEVNHLPLKWWREFDGSDWDTVADRRRIKFTVDVGHTLIPPDQSQVVWPDHASGVATLDPLAGRLVTPTGDEWVGQGILASLSRSFQYSRLGLNPLPRGVRYVETTLDLR